MTHLVHRALARWAARALRPPRRALPTVPGLFALGAPTFLAIAAITATNNLLLLLLGATLGAIVLSGVLSERNIRPIQVRVRPVGAAYAGSPARVEVRFERAEARSAAFDLRFREAPNLWTWRRLRPPVILDVHLPILEGRQQSTLCERVFERRGRARLPICEVSTRHPFGLLVKSKDVEPEVEIWVRPRLVPTPAVLARPLGREGQGVESRRKGQGLDLYGLRERTERDPVHRVHALRSLALGREVVLEMSGIERPWASVGVVTDERADREALERALEIAQAALRAWHREGYAVGLVTSARRFLPGEVEVEALLDHLALVEPSSHRPAAGGPSIWLVPRGSAAPSGAVGLTVGPGGLEDGIPRVLA